MEKSWQADDDDEEIVMEGGYVWKNGKFLSLSPRRRYRRHVLSAQQVLLAVWTLGGPRHRATGTPSHDDDKISSYRVVCVVTLSSLSLVMEKFSFERERERNVSLSLSLSLRVCVCVRVCAHSSFHHFIQLLFVVCVCPPPPPHDDVRRVFALAAGGSRVKTPRETLPLRGGCGRKCHHVT